MVGMASCLEGSQIFGLLHMHIPLSPLHCTYIFTIQYYKLPILGPAVLFVLVIVPPMTITADAEAGEVPLVVFATTTTR